MSPPNTLDNLAAWEASHGTASPLYRRALTSDASKSSDQSLVWVEAQVARGLHPAVIGGSDRHAVLLPGFPTTWVRAADRSETGVVDGIRAHHTFVSRTPASAQLVVRITSAAGTFEMGDEVPVTDGEGVQIEVRVGRATGGRLRVVGGSAVETDEAPADGRVSGEDTDGCRAGQPRHGLVARTPGSCGPAVLRPRSSFRPPGRNDVVLAQPDRLAEWSALDQVVTSALTEVECLRTLDRRRRQGYLDDQDLAQRRGLKLLERTERVDISLVVLRRASEPFPTPLGTLDAIHVASALLWGHARGAMPILATHDFEMATAGRALGFSILGA